MSRKPPLGVMPFELWSEEKKTVQEIRERYKALNDAIFRYVEAGREIPDVWQRENERHVAFLCGVYVGQKNSTLDLINESYVRIVASGLYYEPSELGEPIETHRQTHTIDR